MIHIAIDGPAGAGKSTIAKAVARALAIPYLDTGAMYRALALACMRRGIDPGDEKNVSAVLSDIHIRVAYENGVQHMLLEGEDVTDKIRTPQVSRGASDIGVHPAVREKLVAMQQQVAKEGDVVMDGRDITTVVMPDAAYKFFVTASPRVRAQRRLLEMQEKGGPLPTLEEMEREIRARDDTDSNRACNPLRKTEDSLLVDTSELTIEQSVAAVLAHVRKD